MRLTIYCRRVLIALNCKLVWMHSDRDVNERSNDSCTLRRFTIFFPQWIFYGLTKNVSIISMYRGKRTTDKRNPTNKNAQIFMTWYHLRSFPRDQMSAEKREVCEPIKKRTEEREPSGEVENQELCLAWNEYINILSVARNQISVWFIELIYGFLLSLSLSLAPTSQIAARPRDTSAPQCCSHRSSSPSPSPCASLWTHKNQ